MNVDLFLRLALLGVANAMFFALGVYFETRRTRRRRDRARRMFERGDVITMTDGTQMAIVATRNPSTRKPGEWEEYDG
jgi:hypothetical protein